MHFVVIYVFFLKIIAAVWLNTSSLLALAGSRSSVATTSE